MASAQDMMGDVDLTSPAMASAEMSGQEVEPILAKAGAGAPADFTRKRCRGSISRVLTFPGRFFVRHDFNKTNSPRCPS